MAEGFDIGLSLRSERIRGDLLRLWEDLALARRLGFAAAELPASGLGAIVGGRLLRPRLRRVKGILAEFPGLRLSLHGPDILDLRDLNRAKLQHWLAMATLEMAVDLGVEVLVVHRGADPSPQAQEAEAEALAALADAAAGEVIIAVENGDFPMGELVLLMERLGHPGVGIAYDFGHAQIAAGRFGLDPLRALEVALPYIVHLHVHDNFGRGPLACPTLVEGWPLGEGDLHLPPGWGSVPFVETFRLLRDFQGLCILELHPCFFEPGFWPGEGLTVIEEALWFLEGLRQRWCPHERAVGVPA